MTDHRLPNAAGNRRENTSRYESHSIWRLFAITLLSLFSFAGLANAEDETYGDFSYTVSDSAVTITGYTGSDTSLIIPDTIDGLPVTAIGEDAFWRCDYLTSVIIPDSVTSVGMQAFVGCNALTSIIIPDSVTAIGDYAFEDCTSMASVSIGDGIISIGECAFEDCNALASVTVPHGVSSIGDYAFQYCYAMTRATFLGDAPTMGLGVFNDAAASFCIYYPENSSGFSTPTWNDYAAYPFTLAGNGPTWSDSYELENNQGWYVSDWYGWFYTDDAWGGWIWSAINGWQYVHDLGGDNGIIYYDCATSGWWFTSDSYYPFTYDYADSTWYYYISGTTPNRIFYDYGDMKAVNESEEFQ